MNSAESQSCVTVTDYFIEKFIKFIEKDHSLAVIEENASILVTVSTFANLFSVLMIVGGPLFIVCFDYVNALSACDIFAVLLGSTSLLITFFSYVYRPQESAHLIILVVHACGLGFVPIFALPWLTCVRGVAVHGENSTDFVFALSYAQPTLNQCLDSADNDYAYLKFHQMLVMVISELVGFLYSLYVIASLWLDLDSRKYSIFDNCRASFSEGGDNFRTPYGAAVSSAPFHGDRNVSSGRRLLSAYEHVYGCENVDGGQLPTTWPAVHDVLSDSSDEQVQLYPSTTPKKTTVVVTKRDLTNRGANTRHRYEFDFHAPMNGV